MAIATNVAAIRWVQGNFDLRESLPSRLDVQRLLRDNVLRDVSDQQRDYQDCMAVISRQELVGYASDDEARADYAEYLRANPGVRFFLVHRYEWDFSQES